jgi:ATP-dependent helicase/nuclease subunit A
MSNRAIAEANANQLTAADPQNSVFVTANAGSGKTKVLVDRIARLLLEGSKPSAFLCITYTKAAAAEMQRRLFERLGGWCVAPDDRLRAELDKLGAPFADLARARALFAQALETPGGLKIQTIHAFCERLLARFPLEAGVAPGFDIADEAKSEELLRQARAEAALAADAPIGAFRRFAARMHHEALEELLDRLALRRAEFHRFAELNQGPIFAEAAIRARHGVRWDADGFCKSWVARQSWDGLRDAIGPLSASSKNNQGAAERLRKALDAVNANKPPREIVEACLEVAFKDDGGRYKSIVTAAFAKDHGWIASALEAFADECVRARNELNAIERADDAAAALALALKLDSAYAQAKVRAGALDFDDLIECAQRLLHHADAAPWVLYKLDGGLDHILIDEGQDTSRSQWDLIEPLQQEFFAGRGARDRCRTVFAVGDPKQSIYAFQGADPQRFLDETRKLDRRARQAGAPFKAPELRTSFRSAPEILAAVDAVFAKRALIDGEPQRSDKVKHLAARDAPGVVEVWPLVSRPEAQPAKAWDAPVDVECGASAQAILAKHVADDIKRRVAQREIVWDKDASSPRPMHAGDSLVLVRTRGVLFRELIKALKREDLPVAGADRMVLRDELAVEDCLALMRVALDTSDDLSVACVLKGPWCNLDDDDADIFPLAHGRQNGETLFARLMASTQAKYAEARAIVSAAAARCGVGAFAFLSWALETPHCGGATGWARVFARLGPEARDPLEELLQRAAKPSHAHAATLQRFLHEIESDAGQVKRELEAQTGSVRVMTVHGAKGLEAPVVYLPDATAPPDDKPDAGLIFDDDKGPFVSFRDKDDDAAAARAREAHKRRTLSEHWRLLYVAMTRARDRLIVCGAQHRNGEDKNSWRPAVEEALKELGASACETPSGEGLRLGHPAQIAAVQMQVQSAIPALPAWAKTQAPGARRIEAAAPSHAGRGRADLFSPRGEGQKRFRRGRLIHALLQRLPDTAPELREAAALKWLSRQGVGETEAAALARESLAVVNDSRFAAVFAVESRAEAPIVGIVGGKAVNGIVDRLAIEADRVLVLDFKTDRPAPADVAQAPESYVLQLALYRAVLRNIFPLKTVSCALLWTEKPHLMDLPEASLDAALEAFLRG